MIAVQNTDGREPLQRPDRKSLAHVQGCQKNTLHNGGANQHASREISFQCRCPDWAWSGLIFQRTVRLYHRRFWGLRSCRNCLRDIDRTYGNRDPAFGFYIKYKISFLKNSYCFLCCIF